MHVLAVNFCTEKDTRVAVYVPADFLVLKMSKTLDRLHCMAQPKVTLAAEPHGVVVCLCHGTSCVFILM